jgi:hypothetical protein
MANYWCVFRLAADRAYRSRYEALLNALFALRGKDGASWTEASYYCAFQSPATLDEVAARLGQVIDPQRDLVVVGVVGAEIVSYRGALQHPDAFAALFPNAREMDRR